MGAMGSRAEKATSPRDLKGGIPDERGRIPELRWRERVGKSDESSPMAMIRRISSDLNPVALRRATAPRGDTVEEIESFRSRTDVDGSGEFPIARTHGPL